MHRISPLLVVLIALLAAILLSVSATNSAIAAQEKEGEGKALVVAPKLSEALKKRMNGLKDDLISHHLSVGKSYSELKQYADARAHLLRVLWHDPNNIAAHTALNHELKDGVWDKSAEIPNKNLELPEDERLAPLAVDERVTAFAETISGRAEKLAGDIERERVHVKAQEVWHIVLAYDPHNERACRAVGWVQLDEVWMRREFSEISKKARLILRDASEGTRDRAEDQQANECNLAFTRRKSAYFIARTTDDNERAQRMMQVANGVAKFTQELLDKRKGAPTADSPYTLTLVEKRDDFVKLLVDYQKATPELSAIAKEAGGASTDNPAGFMVLQGKSEVAADDAIGNSVAISVLNDQRSSNSSPWIVTGFPYYVTTHVLDSANTRRFTIVRDGRTRVRGKDEKRSSRGSPFAPEELRRVSREMVEIGDDIALKDLVEKKINDINEFHAAKAFSIFEFLFEEHEAKTREWLKKPAKKGVEDLKVLCALLDMSIDEFDAAWRSWVLKVY